MKSYLTMAFAAAALLMFQLIFEGASSAQEDPAPTRGGVAPATPILEEGPTRSYVEKMNSANSSEVRDGYFSSPQFDVYGDKILADTKAMRDAVSAGDFQGALDKAGAILDQHYAEIEANQVCMIAYSQLGRPGLARRHGEIWIGLFRSIIDTNDGKSPERAFNVITIREEYSVLQTLGFRVRSQSLIPIAGHSYDVFEGTDRNGAPQSIYFQVDRVLAAEATTSPLK
jgi:hypothetical protein